ncbi:uncharacterized protein [Gossypium hirsutum]|uniref:Uncharacterized protein isoform X1 n=1 Tax=Gossypium hirsutum TaxID=3635 RepID=A0A1U8JK86_GOSHI|nr:uncharacterized protein LOC107906267 isoform X1 [Gossypium hirsutum]
MELSLQTLTFTSYCRTLGDSWPKVQSALDHRAFSLITAKPKEHRRKLATPSLALPETAASVAIAATVVGAAATFLVRRTKASDATEVPLRTCEDCEGSGICSECRGEGFVLKKLSEESAERARLTAKNMATRYTAGIGAGSFQTSQEMELLHKMLFYSILYYLWREWKVKLVLLEQQCCVFAQNVAASWKARIMFQLRNRSKLIFCVSEMI